LAWVHGFRLAKTGTYVFVVVAGDVATSYDYNLCMVKNPGPNYPDPGDPPWFLLPGTTVTGRITRGDLDAFGFRVIRGDSFRVTLKVLSGSGTYPVLQLLAPDSSVLQTSSASGSASVSRRCLPDTDIYQVFIYDNGLNEEFEYSLSLVQWPVVPPSEGTNQYLAIYQCNGEVTVRWPTDSPGFTLFSAPTLGPCTYFTGICDPDPYTPRTQTICHPNWTPVTNAPYTFADHFYVDLGVPNGIQFYRLICTNCVSGTAALPDLEK
jgi:hypothetical protein